MDEFEPENILDIFLEYLIALPKLTGKTISQIQEENKEYSLKDIQEIIGKLKKDGYAWVDYETENAGYKIEPHYTSTFEGRMFYKNGGYKAKSLADVANAEEQRLEIDRLRNLDDQSSTNQTRLNDLTRWLVIGSIGAIFAALLLLGWQVWIYYHPEPIPVTVKLQTEKKP